MKTKFSLLLLLLVSCWDKKLNERKTKIGELKVNRYEISLITSVHDHVDITKNGETEHILKINTNSIDTIFLIKDTLVIKTVRRPIIYEKKDKVFNYFIRIDSLPTAAQDTIYWK